jgi:hypothetical protein
LLGGISDIVDMGISSVASIIPGFAQERGDFNRFTSRTLGLPGMNQFMRQYETGFEVSSGIAAVIGSELIARRFTAPAGLVMGALRQTPYLRRIAVLDEQYTAALAVVTATRQQLTSRGLLGAQQLKAVARVEGATFDSATGTMVASTLTRTGRGADLRARVLGGAVGLRHALVTEAVAATVANTNSFLYDDSMSANIMLGALGLGAGTAIDWVGTGYVLRKMASEDSLTRIMTGALDPGGGQASRLESFQAALGRDKIDESIDWFGGAFSDEHAEIGLELAALRAAPLTSTDNPTQLQSSRMALMTPLLEEQRQAAQKLTIKGLPSDQRTGFSMDAPGYGNHVDKLTHDDPLGLYRLEAVGGVAPDQDGLALLEGFTRRVEADSTRISAAIDEMIENAAEKGGKLTPKQQVRLARLQLKMRQLESLKSFSLHGVIDGELVPPSVLETYGRFTPVKVYPSKIDAEKTFWEVSADSVHGKGVLVGDNLDIVTPGGKTLDEMDYYDVLATYRIMNTAVETLARRPDHVITLPKNPTWTQLDMAERLLQKTDGQAKINFPAGMTRDSAQVASLVQKSAVLKKLEAEAAAVSESAGRRTLTARQSTLLLIDDLMQGQRAIAPKKSRDELMTAVSRDLTPAQKQAIASLEGRARSDSDFWEMYDASLADIHEVMRNRRVDRAAEMHKTRVRLNLPKLTAYEAGLLGDSDTSLEFLLRGIADRDPEAMRKLSKAEIAEGIAATRRLGTAAPVTARDTESLSGSSFTFMLDDKGREMRPLVAVARPFKQGSWTQDAITDRLADRKLKAISVATGPQADQLTRELFTAMMESPDFALASRPDQLLESQIQGSIMGSVPQSFVGALTKELKPSEHNFRGAMPILAAGRLRDLAGRITRARMQSVIEGAFGDSLKLLKNPRNEPSKLLLNQFHAHRGGWDLAEGVVTRAETAGNKSVTSVTVTPPGGKATTAAVSSGDSAMRQLHAFPLEKTRENEARWERMFGAPMPEGATLRGVDGREIVLDDIALDLQKRFNVATSEILKMQNTILAARGMGTIRDQRWYVPPPEIQGRYVGWIMGPDKKPVASVIADTAEEFAAKRDSEMRALLESKGGGGVGYVFLTREEITDFTSIWDKALMDMVSPGTTATLPGKRATGGLGSVQTRLNAFSESLQSLETRILNHGDDVVELLFREQINSARARASVAKGAESQGAIGRFAPKHFRTVHDYYVEALLGMSKSTHPGSITGGVMRSIEGRLDAGLAWASGPANRAWRGVTERLARNVDRWSKEERARRDFDSLVTQLGEHMPFKSSVDLAEARQFGTTPLTMAKLTGGINRMTAALTLRILETAHPVMNLAGIINAAPAVIRQMTPAAGEDAAAFAARVGHRAMIFNLKDGKQMAVPDMTKLFGRALKKAWSRSSHADFDFMIKRGYITQEVAEYNKQFGIIDAPGKYEERFSKLIELSSTLSDKSEDFSRSLGHFIGLEVADITGIVGKERRHAFAHDVANKMIANYDPHNRAEVFQGAFGSMIGLFQSFAHNYYSRMFRYVETGDMRSFMIQNATQSALFGVTGLTGFDQVNSLVNWASDGERNPATDIHGAFPPLVADILANGVLSQIPRMFGGEAVNLYDRGDTSVRIPGVGSTTLPGLSAISKIGEGIADGVSAFWAENPGLTQTRMAEILSNMVVNRPLAGMIEQAFAHGNDVDRYGQIVTETKSGLETFYRLAGVRSQRQSMELESYYADKRAQEIQASRKESLRLRTRSAMREDRVDLLPEIWEGYVETGGDPRYFRSWIKRNYESATSTVATRRLDQLMNDPATFSNAMRMMDMGVGVEEDETIGQQSVDEAAPPPLLGEY